MQTEILYPPVLILGCGRSGTSIFGELFGNLDAYEYLSEPPFADVVSRFSEGIAVKVPTESAEYPSDPGLSFPLKTLLEVSPETRIFWIVRHPLDTISSLRVGIGQDWKHHPRPPDWQEWLDKSLVERCAHHWSYINSTGFDALGDSAMVVKFEDMIEQPIRFAETALTATGLGLAENRIALEQWAERVQNTNNEKFVEAQTSRKHSRPDHSVRVGRWRENLSAQDVSTAIPMVAAANERFGYQLG